MTEHLNSLDNVQARFGGLSRSAVRRLIDTGELRSVKIGRRRLVPESALIEYLDSLQDEQRSSA